MSDFIVSGDLTVNTEMNINGNVLFQGGSINLQNSLWNISGDLSATGGAIFESNCWDGSTFIALGDFRFIGYPSNKLNLRASNFWYLNIYGESFTQNLNVEYSDASGGNLIVANDGTSTDYGNNFNWLFGDGPAEVDFSWTIVWDTNTDELPSYWYQVEGICFNPVVDNCTNLPTNTNTGCKTTFIRTILAKNTDEVCAELIKERWTWPIKSIKRWSRPAQNKYVLPDDDCNILEDVENTDICGFTSSELTALSCDISGKPYFMQFPSGFSWNGDALESGQTVYMNTHTAVKKIDIKPGFRITGIRILGGDFWTVPTGGGPGSMTPSSLRLRVFYEGNTVFDSGCQYNQVMIIRPQSEIDVLPVPSYPFYYKAGIEVSGTTDTVVVQIDNCGGNLTRYNLVYFGVQFTFDYDPCELPILRLEEEIEEEGADTIYRYAIWNGGLRENQNGMNEDGVLTKTVDVPAGYEITGIIVDTGSVWANSGQDLQGTTNIRFKVIYEDNIILDTKCQTGKIMMIRSQSFMDLNPTPEHPFYYLPKVEKEGTSNSVSIQINNCSLLYDFRMFNFTIKFILEKI